MKNLEKKYFLAANSAEGFVSYFGESYNPDDNWKVFIIKGGPGTGKSSFMKKVVKTAKEKGIENEVFPCSSDPDSLDAVIFPKKKIVIMDGTSPHTLDPTYPAVCETILNFGDFWQSDLLDKYSKDIIKITNQNKSLHKSAASYIKTAGALIEENLKIANSVTDKEKAEAFALNLCKKHLPKKQQKPKEWIRFLSGITPKGVVSYNDTPLKTCENIVIIEDEFGSVSRIIMKTIRDYALNQGYEIISVKNGFLPSKLYDAVIIPKLSLCFLRECSLFAIKSNTRRIHAKRFMDLNTLNKSREKIKSNKKVISELLTLASNTLSEAKAVHDKLEKFYIEAMDFNSLGKFADSFESMLFK